jgi:hypothetical protein
MEGEPLETPLKVCPSCSVASRTSDESCPNCGAAYVRERRLRWRWWFTVPIVAIAFAIGYGGRQLLDDDSAEQAQSEGIAFELGRSMPLGISRQELIERLSGLSPALVKHRHAGGVDQTCLYYLVTNQEGTAWLYCFEHGKLATSASVIG